MKIFRTDAQAALNSLLVAAHETLDHYRDAAELVEPQLAEIFQSISQQRRGFINLLEDAVRASGELPTVPDPDKEAGAMLLHHVAALFKSDYADDIINQRLEAEQNLLQLVADAKATEASLHEPVLSEFSEQVSQTIAHLQAVHAQVLQEGKK